MARLVAVSIDCRNQAARQTFEDIVSRRRDYLVAKGQGTGSADMLLLELDEFRPQQTFAHIRELLSDSPQLEVFLTASRTDPQILLEAFRLGVKEFLAQPLTRQDVEPALARFEERFAGRVSGIDRQSGRVIAFTREPSASRASTIGTDSSMRRPTRETIFSMIFFKWASSLNWIGVSSNRPDRSTKTCLCPLTRMSLTD